MDRSEETKYKIAGATSFSSEESGPANPQDTSGDTVGTPQQPPIRVQWPYSPPWP